MKTTPITRRIATLFSQMGAIARENVGQFPLELQWGNAERRDVRKPLTDQRITG
jgi:hypothetical protein